MKSDRFGLAVVRDSRHVDGLFRRSYIAELWATAGQSVAALTADDLLDQAMHMLPDYFDEVAGDGASDLPDDKAITQRHRLFVLAMTCLQVACIRTGLDGDSLFKSNGLAIRIEGESVSGAMIDEEPENFTNAVRFLIRAHGTGTDITTLH